MLMARNVGTFEFMKASQNINLFHFCLTLQAEVQELFVRVLPEIDDSIASQLCPNCTTISEVSC
jgi:hypothetical protein